jgi:asparagine synthase (glutamine-hydrolysing)
MCGVVCEVADGAVDAERLSRALATLAPRGPDDAGTWCSPERDVWLGHRRLSIIDLSAAGRQPMAFADGRYQIVYNGEIYNYLELRAELAGDHGFRTASDTEVLLAAYAKWGAACLPKLRGMFAFAIWDSERRELFAARDRFGVKPLYWHATAGGVVLASEIKALHAWGVERAPDEATWASYLATGVYDDGDATFWRGIATLPAGCVLRWSRDERARVTRWYDAAAEAGAPDTRTTAAVAEELEALLVEAVALRFRSDVPVGLCLSGGLDSALLLAVTRRLHGRDARIHTFTFFTGDPAYDELPWVEAALEGGSQPSHFARLDAAEVPELARRVQGAQDEPFGGIPTLGMAKVHALARECGVTVLLDGNGMDEGWAGYEYYARAAEIDARVGPVQGSRSGAVRPECLDPQLAALARSRPAMRASGDAVRDLQVRDLVAAKIPRSMRFADRVSMMESRELREPWLDHRLVELGLRQPAFHKLRDGAGKWLVRDVARRLLPAELREAPKRAVQTPQREWLRGPLAGWARELVDAALAGPARGWFVPEAVERAWQDFAAGHWDNSFPIWQWISVGLLLS